MRGMKRSAPPSSTLARVPQAVLILCLGASAAFAQTQNPAPASTAGTDLGQIEVRANRDNSSDARRDSIASKIVIGREEIERQGDATIGEVIKRLPGVTVQGAPGRGGAIRMRGLGSGYTQILLDGERVPPGFSIDSLTPAQVERIEVQRAPTAETGARAVAGTINIILREGQRGTPDDLQLGLAHQHGQTNALGNWVHQIKTEGLNGTFTLSAQDNHRPDVTTIERHIVDHGVTTDSVTDDQSVGHRQGVHANARLQWRGEGGKSLILMPFLMASDYSSRGTLAARRTVNGTPGTDSAQTQSDSRFHMARLNGTWGQRLSADDRLELKFGLGQSDYQMQASRLTAPLSWLARPDQQQDFNDHSQSLSGKWTRVLEQGHQWVSGVELEQVRRVEHSSAAAGSEEGGDLKAGSQRWALYTQDEFRINPQWSAYGGLRGEHITTTGTLDGQERRNISSVWTPLMHALYKPDPQKRDQIRLSLTRSYKTPTMYNLIARSVSSGELNSWTNPDRVGNPNLRPELATGVDLAFERYLNEGGVLSANLFHRQLRDYIRYTTTFNAGTGRYVSSPTNLGDAWTQGLELEAKFRLNQWWAEAPAVELRSNASFFRSRVQSVPGPNNRLDQQPDMTANFGADYRFRGMPLTVGGNVNFNPDYDTRRTAEQTYYQGVKQVVDVYGLWRFNPKTALRLTLSNLVPRPYHTGSVFDNGSSSFEQSRVTDRNWRTLQLRLEMKI